MIINSGFHLNEIAYLIVSIAKKLQLLLLQN